MIVNRYGLNKNIVIKKNAFADMLRELDGYSKSIILTTQDIINLFINQFNELRKREHIIIETINDYSVQESDRISNLIRVSNAQVVVSIGGGTVSDTAKLSAFQTNRYLIIFPTIISNDGLCSSISVLKKDNHRTEGINSKSPDSLYIDIDIIRNSPMKYLQAGLCDIISNYSALYDWGLAIEAGQESDNSISRLLSNISFWSIFNLPLSIGDDLFIRLISESLILSGIAMELKGNTRPCSGSEHLFNHALTYKYPELKILHGHLVALGSLASSLFQKQNFNKIVEFLKKYKIDVRPSTLGISKHIFIDCWLNAKEMRPDRYTILNIINLDQEYLSNIYDIIEKEGF